MLKTFVNTTALFLLAACSQSDSGSDHGEAVENDPGTEIVRDWVATQNNAYQDPVVNAETSSLPPVENMIDGLEQRLVDDPQDVKGWSLLATSYAFVGRMSDAEHARDKAVALGADQAALQDRIHAAHTGTRR
jgi:predicted Zn-dependent protease